MLQDFSISKCSRKCRVDGHALEPSEVYYSVILSGSEDLERVDISAANWSTPPEEAIGWWKCRMPEAGAKKLKPAPNGVLLDTLSDLVERPGKEPLAYFLALLLVRRQVLSEEIAGFEEEEAASESADESKPPATWGLVCKVDGRQWNVLVCDPSPEEFVALDEELSRLLFTEG